MTSNIPKKESYLPCIICKKRRIKPTHKYYLLGQARIDKVSEGMCIPCAWNAVKERCFICNSVLDKGYPQLLAHCIAHYTSKEILYNQNLHQEIVSLNYDLMEPNSEGNSKSFHMIKCRLCPITFPLTFRDIKNDNSYLYRWINHVVNHYADEELVRREHVGREIFHINYESVLLEGNEYRPLAENESKAYAEALYRMKTSEDTINKNKNK